MPLHDSFDRRRGPTSARASASTARERLLTGDADDVGSVRREIATSWQRSLRMGVVPDSVDVPYDDSLPTPHRLIDAARPVVDRMAAQLVDTSATILLANSEAKIVERWACPSFLPTLDRVNVAPGFVYAEDRVGTNGVGCALEERRLFEVRGPEHFRDCLQSLVCVAAPIVLRTTNVVHGALNVTCTIEEANGLLRPLIQNAIADIERHMLEAASLRERRVLDAFLSRSRGSRDAVLAVSDDLVMANHAAERIVVAADRAALWHWASEVLRTRDTATRTYGVDDGEPVELTATRIDDGTRLIGALLQVRLPSLRVGRGRGARASSVSPNGTNAIVGRSPAAVRLRRAVAAASGERDPLVVVGPSGSGRTYVATSIAACNRPRCVIPITDATRGRVELEQLAGADAIIVRHVDTISVVELAALLHAAHAADVHLIATAADGVGGSGQVALFGRRVDVVPLRFRIDDLPVLATRILAELTGDGRRPALRRDALRALMRHDWPGNIRELRGVLSTAVAAAGGSDIAIFHLPASFGAGIEVDRWSPIELAERRAILSALRDHDGNKVAAASSLGLARSTLYRKLRAFAIDVA
jgi:transcriptional regulator of acetoin/glycerol metabolism